MVIIYGQHNGHFLEQSPQFCMMCNSHLVQVLLRRQCVPWYQTLMVMVPMHPLKGPRKGNQKQAIMAAIRVILLNRSNVPWS